MKRLLIAIAAAATTMFASAAVLKQAAFEGTLDGGFTGDGGTPKQYKTGVDEQTESEAYPFDSFGKFYCDIDADTNEPLTSPSTSGAVFDMFVQFTPMTETPTVDDDAKIAIYLNSATNLVVVGDKNYEFANVVAAGEWARLTIVPVSDGYKVSVGGVPLLETVFTAKSTGAASYVTFTGTGKLDNFVARTTDPFGGAPTGWIANIGTDDPEQYFTDYTKALEKALAGATLTFADPTVQMDGSAAHPFEIRSEADLKALQQAVAAGNGADKCYVQTADIALTEAWPGIGLQNGKDVVSDATKFDVAAFCGTFDGQNHTISNFQMQGGGLDYCGFFNSTYGATIKNLKIQYAGALFAADTTDSTKESGATFVGVAKSSTLQNLTSLQKDASTGVSCSKGFGGIVGYTTSGTTVDSCTNNVNMTSLAKNKCGGIAMIRQSGSGSAVIRNCQNNGTVTTGSTNGEFGGIVGYVGDDITIADCESIVAYKFFHRQKRKDNSVPVVTMSGVNKGNATTVPAYTSVPGDALVTGLNFATVDGDVATFVADDELVLDGTVEYKVMNANAAYAFAAAGTLALDQSLATATVTADESKFVFTASGPVDNVTTYTAVAGVASVGGVAYATLAEAVAELTSNDNELLILADLPTDAAPKVLAFEGDIVVKVADGVSFGMGLAAADGYMISGMLPGADSVTYTVAVDTRKFKVISNGVATRYSTFKDAYGAATDGDSLEGEIDGDIAIGSDYGDSKALASVTFTTTSEDPISVMTAYHYTAGTGYDIVLTASAWSVPANATLTLESQTVTSVAAGTLNVPAGVTLRTADGGAFAGVSNLTGTGRVVVSGTAPAGSLQALCQKQGWTGTLELANVDIGSACNLKLFGNANSTVCFNNVGCALMANNESVHAIGTLEIGAGGFELIGNYSGGVFTLPCAVTGTGTFKVSAKDSAYGTDRKDVKFTGDVSGFTGNITFDDAANARVVFGTGTYPSAAAAKCIIVTPGTELTLPSAATWSAPAGIIVQGGLDVQGTLNVPASNLYGTGVIKFHDAAKAVRAADSWEGTYRIDWVVPSGAFTIGDYGRKANGTIEIMRSPNNGAYPAPQKLTVVPTVKLNADWTINNGWHSAVGESTFTKLTGSGNLTVNGTNSGTEDIWYTFTTLENYTGTLGGNRGKFKIGTLVSAVDPQPGAKLVSLKSGTREFRDLDQTVVKYNNETVEVELEQKDDGIYVALPPAPKVAEIVGGEQFETLAGALAAATDGATVKLLDDITLDARVEPNVGANTSLTIDLGGYTITREGTSGNGSVFDVKSGNVVITNGVIDCTQDDAAIVADGVYAITARSGANVTLGGLTVTVNSQAGACAYPFPGATLAITSGTYRNNTAEPYQYKTGWTGMAVNQANVEQQLITISGGSFYQVNPAEGDDSGKVTSFLAANCESTYDSVTGFWTVSEKKGFPGGEDGKTFTIDDAVQTALEAKLPTGKALTDPVAGTTSGLTYAQAYALDLFDEDTGTVEDVKPTIEIVNGKVVVSLDATAKAGYKVMLNVYVKASLTAQWPEEPTTSYELGSEEEAAGFTPSGSGFYKIGITIEDAE